MNITGLKNKKKLLIIEIKELKRIPDFNLNWKQKSKLRSLAYNIRWVGEEINRLKIERQRKEKKG